MKHELSLPVWWEGDALMYEDTRYSSGGVVLHCRGKSKKEIEKAIGIMKGEKMKNNIQKRINELGWDQPYLAGLVGVKREYINRIIKGHVTPTVPLAIKIAKALDCMVESLFILE